MDITALPPVSALLAGAVHLITGLAAGLAPVAGTASAALAIVLVTIAVRVAMIPLGIVQGRADHRRRALAPELRALRRRWPKNPERLHREVAALHRRAGVSPLSGAWAALVPLPVVTVLYTALGHATLSGHANAMLGQRVLGVPLGTSLTSVLGGGGPLWPALAVEAALLAALAVIALLGRRRALADLPREETTALTRAMTLAPFASVVFAALAPLAAAFYLVVTTGWTLAERAIIRARLERRPLSAPPE